MIEITCPFCDIDSGHVIIEENGYQGKKCPQCGLIYISPRPSLDEIVNLYGHDDANISAQTHISADFQKRLYAKHNLGILRSIVRRGKLLEIGAGAGYFLDEARKNGFDPYGLEFNSIQAEFIRNRLGIPCEESSLNTSIFGGKRFDVIYHCDVISHFYDPIGEFRTMNKLLAEDGFLFFETGNGGDIDKKYFKLFVRWQYPDHLFFFSMDNVANLLKITGFEQVSTYRYSIQAQLYMLKTLAGLRKRKVEKGPVSLNDAAHKTAPAPQQTKSGSILKRGAKSAYHLLNYVLRYKVGRIAPKGHRPQTVLFIAKKRA